MTPTEQRVINHLRKSKGHTSIFWVTDNQARAKAVERLEQRGVLKRSKEHGYPSMYFEVKEGDRNDKH